MSERNLRRERLTTAEILERARTQQIGSIDDIHWGVLEPNGKISFVEK